MPNYKFVLTLLVLLLVSTYHIYAQGDLLITPRRVTFEGSKQRESLNLVNIGKDTTSYSITFIQYNMNEDGSFKIIEHADSTQMFADRYLRIFPRSVTLAPGEPQVIMVQYRRQANMMDGEYRSHLYFRSEENYKPLGTENALSDSSALSVRLIPIFGISIPIIIRTGEVRATASLSDLELETFQDSNQILKLSINREGNISVYGDIIVEYFPPSGRSYEVGLVRGVGVYTNLKKRNLIVKLNVPVGKALTNGRLRVKYISNNDKEKLVYAEASLEIGN